MCAETCTTLIRSTYYLITLWTAVSRLVINNDRNNQETKQGKGDEGDKSPRLMKKYRRRIASVGITEMLQQAAALLPKLADNAKSRRHRGSVRCKLLRVLYEYVGEKI